MRFTSCLVVALATLACLWAWPAAAEWPHDPAEGVPLCNTAINDADELVVSDGEGGAIVVWRYADVYAQRIDADGVVQWTTDGVAVCTATGTQWYPDVTTDGAGGVIVAWEDQRTTRDIYAQRVDSSGNVMWTTDGVLICGAAGSQYKPKIATDGAGGAIIVWQDSRNPSQDVYAQRVDSSGAVQWLEDGVAVCSDASAQYEPNVASDGDGGAYFVWQDWRVSDYDIYALHVNSACVSTWTTDGEVMCAATGNQTTTQIIADGSGGAILSWYDERGGVDKDIYAQRVLSNGDVQWGADGVAVGTEAGNQDNHRMVSDGAVGAIIAWEDDRVAMGEDDIYAQKISAFGIAQWTTDGVAICTAPNRQYWPRITTDGLGGAIVTWPDYRYGTANVYAQRVDAAGAVQWSADGEVICSLPSSRDPELIHDGAGGAIIAWEDSRDGDGDIYAQKIERNGFLGYPSGRPTSAVDHPDDQGDQIVFSWNASYLDEWPMSDVDSYSVWRRYGGAGARRVAPAALPRGSVDLETLAREGWVHVDDVDAMQLSEYGYVVPSFGDSTESGTVWTDLMVLAHSTSVGDHWMSEAISGYSVDNLAPGAPLALGAEVVTSDVELTWSPSGYYDEDLSE